MLYSKKYIIQMSLRFDFTNDNHIRKYTKLAIGYVIHHIRISSSEKEHKTHYLVDMSNIIFQQGQLLI